MEKINLLNYGCKLFNEIKNNYPLIIAVSILWAIIVIVLIKALNLTQGHFCYIFDDPYIHMAISKHLVLNGVWGVTPYNFSSSSSSILWPLLIATAYYFVGVNEITPLILNILFATTTLILVYFILKRYQVTSFYNLVVLSCLIFFSPIPLLIFSGMEHLLHILLSISFIYMASTILSDENNDTLNYYLLIILAVLLVMTRYEGLALVFIVTLLFLARGRFLLASSLIGISLLPVVIYGIVSTLNGWFFIPNSLLMKSSLLLNGFSLLKIISYLLKTKLSIFLLFALSACVFIIRIMKNRSFWDFSTIMISIFLFIVISYMLFVPYSTYFRHDAHVVAVGILTVSMVFYDYIKGSFKLEFNKKNMKKCLVITILFLFLISPFADRTYSVVKLPEASKSIYEQQYQMSLFLKEYYQGESIALNDIGVIDYMADVKITDIMCLGSIDVAREIKNKSFLKADISQLMRNNQVKVVVVYDFLFKERGIPYNWIKVGEWKISDRMFSANDTVSFYVVNPEDEKELTENLRAFSSKLPKDVKQSGEYIH